MPLSANRIIILLFTGLYFVIACVLAAQKPYWLDETVSVGIAALPNVQNILAILAAGKDAHPPLSFLLIHFSFALFGPGELPARLPSILAFFGALVAVYHFLRFRFSTPIALAGTVLLAISPACYYATEARSYALLLAAAAGAALAWQRRSHLGLAAAFAFSISSHYYAVLLAPVFVIATLVRERRAALPTLTAITVGFLPLFLYLPLIHSAFTRGLSTWQFNPDNIARPSIGQLGQMLLRVFIYEMIPLLLLVALLLFHRLFRQSRPNPESPSLPLAEKVLAGCLLLLPPVLLAISKFTVGAFFERYVIPWHLGVALLLATAHATLCSRPAHAWAFLASCLAGPLLFPPVYKPFHTISSELRNQWDNLALPPGLPIVYADALDYNSVCLYAPPAIRNRLLYVHDIAVSRLTRDPVPEQIIVQLGPSLFPFRAELYAQFVASRPTFLLFTTGLIDREWLPGRLRTDGYQFTPLRTLRDHTLYRVSPPEQ